MQFLWGCSGTTQDFGNVSFGSFGFPLVIRLVAAHSLRSGSDWDVGSSVEFVVLLLGGTITMVGCAS